MNKKRDNKHKKENIVITVDLWRDKLKISNPNGRELYKKKFTDYLSSEEAKVEFYSKDSEIKSREKILKEYIKNKKLSEEEIKNIKDRIKNNMDVSVYEGLKDYDITNSKAQNDKTVQAKSSKYMEIMLKTYKNMDKRQASIQRRKELKKAGIEIEYELNKEYGMDELNFKNIPEKLRAFFNAYKSRKSCATKIKGVPLVKETVQINHKEKYFGKMTTIIKQKRKEYKKLKSEKEWEKIKLHRAKLRERNIQQKLRLADKKQKAKQMKQNKEKRLLERKNKAKQFILRNKKRLAIAGISVVAISSFVGSAQGYFNNPKYANNPKQEQQNNKDEDNIVDRQEIAIKNNAKLVFSNSDFWQNIKVVPTENNVASENISTIEKQTSTNVEDKEALMESLQIGIGSEFYMNEGIYYEVSDGSGKTGHYEKFNNEKMQINYIVAIEGDTYYLYDEEDEKTIAQIKKEHPNAQFSYHVVTESGRIAGWNKSDENAIEDKLIENAQNTKNEIEYER